MEFRKIDRSNYWECMELTVDDSQKDFVKKCRPSPFAGCEKKEKAI